MVDPLHTTGSYAASRSRWNVRFSVFWSGLFCLVAASVLLSQIAGELALMLIGSRLVIDLSLPLLVILTAVILAALSMRLWRSVWGVLGLTAVGILAASPTILAVLSPQLNLPSWFFIASLLFWVLVTIAWVSWGAETLWSGVLLGIGGGSAVIWLVCGFGLWSPIRFAEGPLAEFRSLGLLLDIRLSTSVLFLTLALLTAVVRAALSEFPRVPQVPTVRIDQIEEGPVLAPLLNPPIIVVNLLIFVLVALVNALLGIALTALMFLLFTGREFGELLWRLFTHRSAIVRLGKALLSAFVTFGVTILALEGMDSLQVYLRSADSYVMGELLPVLGLSVSVVVAAVLVVLVIDGARLVLQRVLFGASLLVVLLLISGGMNYLVVLSDALPTHGFEHVGPISAVGAALIFCGLLAITVTHMSRWRRHGPGD